MISTSYTVTPWKANFGVDIVSPMPFIKKPIDCRIPVTPTSVYAGAGTQFERALIDLLFQILTPRNTKSAPSIGHQSHGTLHRIRYNEYKRYGKNLINSVKKIFRDDKTALFIQRLWQPCRVFDSGKRDTRSIKVCCGPSASKLIWHRPVPRLF